MKDWYFHQERGQTVGPVAQEEMKTRIRSGRIRMFDLIYREGDPGWRMAIEHPDLKGEFRNVNQMSDRPWVCLQRKSEEGFDFGTTGPFSTDEIRESLLAGRISYSDYVWREGYKEWRRLGTIEDFNRRTVARPETSEPAPPPLPEIPARDLLKNVVELKKVEPARQRTPPPEATTPDLAAGPPAPVAPKKYERDSTAKTRIEIPMPDAHATKVIQKTRRRSAWADWLVVMALVGVLGAVAFFLYKYEQEQNPVEIAAPEPEPPPPASPPSAEMARSEPALDSSMPPAAPPEPTPGTDVKSESPGDMRSGPVVAAEPEPPPQSSATVAEKETPAKPAARQDVPPTELHLVAQSTGVNQVKIELRTDASSGYPVYLQIIGLPGQVSEGASFYRFLKLTPSGDRRQPVDLGGLNLPQGRFILRAETGKLKKETRMNVGVNEPQFKQTVARLRKVYAHAVWQERLELYRLATLLEKNIGEAAGGKRFSEKGLGSLNAVKRANGANYVLVDQWFELKEILAQAKTAPTVALVGRARQARERASGFSVWK